MHYEKPEFVEIKMDAEIGTYQADFDERTAESEEADAEDLIDDAGERVVLAVKNRGPPIPPELLPDIFDPFLRGKHAPEAGRASQGLGLGLYIAHEIVRAHQGRIGVESDLARGTTFRVELPRSLARAA